MCNNTGTSNFLLVEVQMTGAQNQFSLKDEEILRTAKKIVAIEVYKVDNVTITPKGAAVVNNTVFEKAFLVIGLADDKQPLMNIPFTSMDKTANQGRPFFVNIPPIAPSKCFVQVGTQAGIVPGEVFLIGFHYER